MTEIKPIHYSLAIAPELSDFSFSAEAIVELEASAPVEEVELNVLELAIWQCAVQKNGQYAPCRFSVDTDKEVLTVFLPEKTAGKLVLKIAYEGKINDKMAGFYRSGYKEDGRQRYIAVTQFQESDARRAIPCMDQPGMKASFDVEMVLGSQAQGRLQRDCAGREEDGRRQEGGQVPPDPPDVHIPFVYGAGRLRDRQGRRGPQGRGTRPSRFHPLREIRRGVRAHGAYILRRIFPNPLSASQDGLDRGAGLRVRGHGELGRHHVQGKSSPLLSGDHVQGRGAENLRG